MAWNEPGGGRDQDPWGGRKKEDGPPDLDELVRKIQEKFGGLFGGKGGGGGAGRGGSSMPFGVGVLVAIALVVWALSGIYIIDPAQQGVVLRFGKYETTVGPGPHWHLPYPIESVSKVNVEQVRRSTPVSTQMLTKDQNLIRIQLTAQFQVSKAEDYLFSVADPDHTLDEATESALRDVVGSMNMDDILSVGGGREVLVKDTRTQIQAILDLYKTGLRVTKVNLESTQPPQEVQAAFEDAINAEEDEDRYKKQAEAYANDIIPKAQGDAQSILERAHAYRQQIVDRAKGETSRFLQTLKAYRTAPEITRQRMYIESMESVLKHSSKVVVKVPEGNNIMYIPLDRLMQQGNSAPAHKQAAAAGASSSQSSNSAGHNSSSTSSSTSTPIRPESRDSGRERGGR
jgi:membrane protease subunit HflK